MVELLERQNNIGVLAAVKELHIVAFIIIATIAIVYTAFYVAVTFKFHSERGNTRSWVFYTVESLIIFIVLSTALVYIAACINTPNVRKDNMRAIVTKAIEEDIEIEITESTIIYNGKAYQHRISSIDEIVVTDKNGNLVLVEE